VDGSQLKVFKYTLSGSLLGSWSIDPADTHPTGITINPNNVSDIWIVDNGTDKVYQYIGAASRSSGSQNAGATFALAAGNTNPQGIADPQTSAPGVSSATDFTRTFGSPADPVIHGMLERRSPTFSLSMTRGTAVCVVMPTLAAGSVVAPLLTPLASASDQDLTLLALDLIHSGRKRSGTSNQS
jgi:hypothetical protein